MKEGIHPRYEYVIIKDSSSDFAFLTRSTKTSSERMQWTDGKEYPLIHVEISSASHPFFTGKQKLMDSAGRIERFQRKYAKHSQSSK